MSTLPRGENGRGKRPFYGREICRAVALAIGCLCGVACGAADLYFSINDEANKNWDYAPGWKANSGVVGVLPTADDTTTFNSTYLDVAAGRGPLAITNGVAATCRTCWLGSMAFDDHRRIGFRIDGGSLDVGRHDGNWDCLTVGHVQNANGLIDIASGRVRAQFFLVGREGSGIVTNRGGFVCLTNWNARMILGTLRGSEGRYVQTAGAVGAATNDQLASTAIAVGHAGHGIFELAGGVVSNRVVVGTAAGGSGEMLVSGGTLRGNVVIGSVASATGRLEVTGGTLMDNIVIGKSGYGVALFNAPDLAWNVEYQIGSESGGVGIITNVLPISGISTLYAGISGEGHVHAKANVTASYVKISASTNVTSTMTVYAGATNLVGVQLCIGGSVFPAQMKAGATNNFDVPGHGVYILRGGALKFTDNTSTARNLYVGRTAATCPGTWGILRGYGAVLPAWAGQTNVRMALGAGQIIADGEGEERSLDLTSVVNVTNTVPVGETDTTGWYAVNRGCVLFPRTWYGSDTTFSRAFGDAPYASAPCLVNSLAFTIRQTANANNFFRGGVYATDRTDLHLADLPPNDGVVGCWKLGVFDGVSGTGKRAFTDIALTFRYDAAKAPDKRKFSLWRHDGTAWTRVGRAVRAEGTIPRIATTAALGPVAQTYNVGTFAVTADRAGLTVIVR